jgi:hypothetical protein
MSKKIIWVCVALGSCLAPAARATTVIWVSDRYDEKVDGVPDDFAGPAFLESQGYTVDYRPGPASGNGYWRTLDAARIAELNAADVIIVSRCTDSGNYASDATEVAQWNGITAPIILMTPYNSRNSRWIWYNNATLSEDSGTPTLQALDPHHPLFKGVSLDAKNQVDIYDQKIGSGTTSLVGVLDNGNGTLLAKTPTGTRSMIAEWKPGTPFYNGGAQTPAGKRLLLCGGTREGGGQGRGEFNLNDEGKKLLVNAIEYMIGNLVREPWVKAWLPEPADGTLNVALPLFRWTAGEMAVFHHVYFGTTPELLEANLVAGKQPLAMYFHVPALEPGTKYYWRVDEVQADGTVHTGDVWSFSTASLIAYEPRPRDGAKWIDQAAVTLTWQPGQNALKHDLYFGTDKDAVTQGVAGVFKGNQAAPTFSAGQLAADTTYYWRVDEIMFDGTKRTGAVWSFTTLAPGGGLRAYYYANAAASGTPAVKQIDPQINFNWAAASPQGLPADGFSIRWVGELEVPFSETYTFYTNTDDGVRLWVNDVQILDLWANRRSPTEAKASIKLTGGQRYPIAMEFYNAEGTAVAELWWESPSIDKALIPQPAFSLPLRASGPNPGSAAVHVPQTSTLAWSAGEKAARHDVYFGADADAVANGTTASATVYQGRQALDNTTFDPGVLEWGKTYYWRIDEVNDAAADSPWKGAVWSFTAADFVVVDNFESYNDDIEAKTTIFDTWIDGFTNGLSGSTVGNIDAPFAEQAIVHSGKQSMPMDYNNVNPPFFSETEREFAPVGDWTVNGVDTLTLYFRGNTANGAGALYVAVEDSAGKRAVITNPDAAAVTKAVWTEWKIPLSSLTGVNPARVKKMYLGVGDRNAPAKGGAGRIYIDDIRVTKP